MPININIEGPEAKNRRLMQEQEQALRLRILDQQYKQSQPGYSAETAGRLGRGLEESERNLQLQDELLADLSKRKQNVAAAATPLQPQVAGPVMPEQAAISETNRILTAEDQMGLDRAAALAQREAMRKDLETLTGTVPLPTGGTAAAGETSTIKRRFEDTAKLIQGYNQRVASAQSPEEADALRTAYSMFEPIQKQQLKKDLESSRTIPGLEGFGKDEQATNEMRKSIVDFSSATQNIDDLINLSNNPSIANYAKAQAIRGGLRGQLRLLIAGPGAMSDQDVALMNEIVANPYTPYAKEKLLALKGAMARKIVSSASAYGFKVKRLSDLVSSGGQPEDFNEFTSFTPSYKNEAEARGAGYKDGDIIKIGGKKYRLGP
jgi:hypothetical protein